MYATGSTAAQDKAAAYSRARTNARTRAVMNVVDAVLLPDFVAVRPNLLGYVLWSGRREFILQYHSLRHQAEKRSDNSPLFRRWRYRRQQTHRLGYFFMVTIVMPFTRLLASTKLPSGVTDVLRTMLPPPGIAQLWNFVVLGSKRTMVFGVEPDSLYQMTSLIVEMP